MNIFFDNGCGDLVVRKKAVDLLLGLGRAKCEISEAMEVTGVGDQKAEALGLYSICLPFLSLRSILTTSLNFILSGVNKLPTAGLGIDGLYRLHTSQFLV